ncbi:MAG: ABC transporter permease [Desertimonas sp.]
MRYEDLRLLAGREISTRLRDRGFVLSTLFSVVVIVAIAVLPRVFGGGTESWEIGAVGASAEAAADRVATVAPPERHASVVVLADEGAARAAVASGDVDVVVLADGTLLGNERVNADLSSTLQQSWATQALADRLGDLGIEAGQVDELLSAPPSTVELLDPPDEERDRRVGFVGVGAILMFMQLIGYGVWVAMAIVEDKTSQVIEVLLAKVSPRCLLSGKVAGIGLLGVGQLVLMIAAGLGAFTLADRFPVPRGVWPMAVVLVVAFVLAFGLYASLFAISGAIAARVEDVQSASAPFTLIMTGAYVGAIAALQDPAGNLARWISWIPFSSPLVMPLRIADGSVAWWEVAGATIILLASILVCLAAADRAYRAGALRLRKSVSLRHAFRSAVTSQA